MRQLTVILFVLISLSSCSIQKNLQKEAIGKSKHQIILELGIPTKTSSDGAGGEVMLYSRLNYDFAGNTYWRHVMFYIGTDDKCYYATLENAPNPPQDLNINLNVPHQTHIVTGYEK